jgi:hypothetical protein
MGYSAEKWCKTQWRDGGTVRSSSFVVERRMDLTPPSGWYFRDVLMD